MLAAYPDDICCVEKLRNVLTQWNKTNTFGPKIGSFPKAKISWLIVNPEEYETAKVILKDTKLNITNIGKRNLGAVGGTSEIPKFYSQAACCAFLPGFRQKISYII